MEKWADIEGYELYYKVSTLGRVKSLDNVVWNGNVYHAKKGRVLKLQSNGNYAKVTLSKEGKTKQFLVHRLVAKAFIFNGESKPEVNHIDKDTYNNNVVNLEWVTSKENDTHKRTFMRYKDSIVEVILIEREQGRTYKEIADKLKITIYKVKKVVRENGQGRKDKTRYMDNE